jgi:hypothetical protein
MWQLSQFVPASVTGCPNCVPKGLPVNYHLILLVALLITSILYYTTLGQYPKAKKDTSKQSSSDIIFSRMHNYFQHQRPVAQDIIVPSTRPMEPEDKERIVQETTRRVKQPYDVFLVLDVEATCLDGGEQPTTDQPSLPLSYSTRISQRASIGLMRFASGLFV